MVVSCCRERRKVSHWDEAGVDSEAKAVPEPGELLVRCEQLSKAHAIERPATISCT